MNPFRRRTQEKKKNPALHSAVTIAFDRWGVPSIRAHSRADAIYALGFVNAQERLFQMDLFRRISSGRLAEVMGQALLATDREQRTLGLSQAAKDILARLSKEQVEILESYTHGVNTALKCMKVLPVEFLGLRYKPEPWTPDASILVGLYLSQQLSYDAIADERMLTIMERLLPPEVFAFFTCDDALYETPFLVGSGVSRPPQPIPVQMLQKICQQTDKQRDTSKRHPVNQDKVSGSNGWVLGPSKSRSGLPLLANDMHLDLTIPNLWYRAQLLYEDVTLTGVMMPGLPLILAGSNSHVTWSFTNLLGDVIDLVQLELHPQNARQYRTPLGWQTLETIQETIYIRGKEPEMLERQMTIWGPVSSRPLLQKTVAIHWASLDIDVYNIDLLDIDRAKTIQEAISIFHRFGSPPLNVLLADEQGHIAWTCCGKIPRRKGFDGSLSRSWADGSIGWDGYVPSQEMPVCIDPPEGYIVNANNRPVGASYPYPLGHNFVNNFRAWSIRRRLQCLEQADEDAMLKLQLDTTVDFYEFYQTLALSLLTPENLVRHPNLQALRRNIERWDKQSNLESQGIAILQHFRARVQERIISAYLKSCYDADDAFRYKWLNVETPCRQLLSTQVPETLPYPDRYSGWQEFLIDMLELTMQELSENCHVIFTETTTWADLNVSAGIKHPLAQAVSFLDPLLSMRNQPTPGCTHSIRVAAQGFGATLRMSITPGQEQRAIFHMPGGQSGHPWLRQYRDQHRYWAEGRPLPFLPELPVRNLLLTP